MTHTDDIGRQANGRDDADRGLAPEALFTAHLDFIRRAVHHCARRHGLAHQDRDDFESEVNLKLIDDGYRVLRHWDGRSSLKTYLYTVIARAYSDFQIKRWGKFRPSAIAEQLGPDAVTLERLMHHEGRSFEDACAIMAAAKGRPVDRERLATMAACLPVRAQRRTAGPGPLETVPASNGDPGADLAESERTKIARHAGKLLVEALKGLGPDDRLVLKLHYFRGLPLSEIARTLGRDQRRLYRARDRSLAAMRAYMQSHGLSEQMARSVLGHLDARVNRDREKASEVESPDTGPSHPSGDGEGDPDPK